VAALWRGRQDGGMDPAAALAGLSRWIDDHPANAARDREAALWGRIAKVTEEAGEVTAALISVTGQNPRKPASGSFADVEKELLDVAVTALAAVEHLRGNDAGALGALHAHLEALAVRAGLAG
jgi:NTP pyrophosphatase (non-canonical NTP hydrolase)